MARNFLRNRGFELGNNYWVVPTDFTIVNNPGNARSGAWVGQLVGMNLERRAYLPAVSVRPGGSISASAWFNGGTNGLALVRVFWRDAAGVPISFSQSTPIGPQVGYVENTMTAVAPSRAKRAEIGIVFATSGGLLDGTWYIDDFDASGDIIETIPSSAIIASHRWLDARTIGEFDPLVGSKKFSDFNAGMSDKWAGLYTFVPALGTDLDELIAFLRRLGKAERFFAYHPDRRTPRGGVVNGLTVDGGAAQGVTRIPVTGGTASTTPLVERDFVEIGAQYFEVQRDLEIGPEGTGELIVWPSVRTAFADGEEVITDNPKMVARITSDLDERQAEARPVELSVSWEEVG